MSPPPAAAAQASPAAPLKVAVAGLGFGEKVHLVALRDQPRTEPVVLWHPRPERLEAACRAAELPGHSDFDALLADPGIEAVVIATPPAVRFDLARRALEAGKHLLLEKPAALHADQVEDLRRLALARRLCVAVNFEYRAVPVFQQLKALLEQGVLGIPYLVKLDWLMGSRSDTSRPWNWYSQRSEGGGVIGSLGTHAFDTLHWLIGPSLELSASTRVAIPERPLPDRSGRRAPVDAEDIALAHLSLEVAPGQAVAAQMNLAAVTRRGRGYWIELYGSQATLVLGSDNQSDYVHGFQLWISRGGEPLQPVPPDPALAFARTWMDGRIAPVRRLQGWWAEAVRADRPMVPGLAEAVQSQRCCDATLRSAVSGLRERLG
ncbi:Gfo/Idh/MocA family protein [Cyanobium sp. Morenito 9A2]|uniref:Gfo/Idh/MocA family protein n=1 Tax=Cyanobium sp. Morenito 9A2 TaxID=2823718 RepID=UPI0020CFB10E|nr:Gfo/Idh/MocA family oxidoreductase [Cyanobium sp. Morenito 9A2]MCP9848666.1 Gfo/Idh/MocA family oxidoreductase [Cyanobium sp. Morenito 9A2]